jgi:hypothetical protein
MAKIYISNLSLTASAGSIYVTADMAVAGAAVSATGINIQFTGEPTAAEINQTVIDTVVGEVNTEMGTPSADWDVVFLGPAT